LHRRIEENKINYKNVNHETAFMLVAEGAWNSEEFKEWFLLKEVESYDAGVSAGLQVKRDLSAARDLPYLC
jgi:hypothetical protein